MFNFCLVLFSFIICNSVVRYLSSSHEKNVVISSSLTSGQFADKIKSCAFIKPTCRTFQSIKINIPCKEAHQKKSVCDQEEFV